jgi:alkylresorcinol/alkylpyrone synthase
MSSIVSVGTAVPPYLLAQEEACRLAGEHFAGTIDNIDKYLQVFKNALVSERHFCVDAEWFAAEHSLAAKNRLYLKWAETLSIQAIEACLDGTGTACDEIDNVVFVSSSGIATPSLDVALINRLGFKRDVRRLPLFGLGCAGGAAGIALCNSLIASRPKSKVLLVAVEINSLTFQRDDMSKSNLVATSLFGDGAAAVLFAGDGDGKLDVLNSVSLLRPHTDHLMGWDFVDTGFRVVFSRAVPQTIMDMMPDTLSELTNSSGLRPNDIGSFIFHPGGKRILEAYQKVLGRGPEYFAASYAVLDRYGNMSSATVLFVLAETMRNGQSAGDHGLLAAFGPGFSAEATLLRST